MDQTQYFVLTQMIVDDVYFPWGEHKLNQLGGGTYTVAGMRIWSEDVGFCCALGPDFEGNYDRWFLENRIDMAGAPRAEKCVHAKINYFEDGEREELLLPGCGSHAQMLPLFREIPQRYDDASGMYFFKDCDERYWADAEQYLRGFSGLSCWEIQGSACLPENRDRIADCLSLVDMFSLNMTEGRRITGRDEPIDVLRRLQQMHAKALILRMGAKGALVSHGDEVWHIPAVPTNVVDVTGGGNSSTGGFITGYCQTGGDIVHAGLCAAVSASFIISQWGVPPHIDAALMSEAKARLSSVQPTRL